MVELFPQRRTEQDGQQDKQRLFLGHRKFLHDANSRLALLFTRRMLLPGVRSGFVDSRQLVPFALIANCR